MLKKLKNKLYLYLAVAMVILSLAACADKSGAVSDIKQNSLPLSSGDVSETQSTPAEEIKSEPQSSSSENSVSQKEETVSKKPENSKTESVQSNSKAELITKDKALEIALADAGGKKTDARDIDIELDYEKSLRVYEVDFETKGFEYSYEINAVSGEILQREKEADR